MGRESLKMSKTNLNAYFAKKLHLGVSGSSYKQKNLVSQQGALCMYSNGMKRDNENDDNDKK